MYFILWIAGPFVIIILIKLDCQVGNLLETLAGSWKSDIHYLLNIIRFLKGFANKSDTSSGSQNNKFQIKKCIPYQFPIY